MSKKGFTRLANLHQRDFVDFSATWNVGKFHHKFELRKASGLDSWKAVPTPTFLLDLGPCHFTNEYGLMGGY